MFINIVINIIIVIIILITTNEGWNEIPKFLNEKRHRRELAEFYIYHHRTNDDKKTILKKFKQDRSLYNEIEKEFQEEQKRKHYYEESIRKQKIIERVFAYDYEDMLYQIFAPYSKKTFHKYWHCFESIGKNLLIQRISEIKQIPVKDAENIFQTLFEHHLIYEYGTNSFILTPMLEETKDNGKGWDVVTDIDMNLSKWMDEHGYKHKEK